MSTIADIPLQRQLDQAKRQIKALKRENKRLKRENHNKDTLINKAIYVLHLLTGFYHSFILKLLRRVTVPGGTQHPCFGRPPFSFTRGKSFYSTSL